MPLPRRGRRISLTKLTPPEADLPQILHLADMLVQLLGSTPLARAARTDGGRRSVSRIDQARIDGTWSGNLQPQVEQLADVLSLELAGDRDYVQTLVEAHERLGVLAEEIGRRTAQRRSADDPAYTALLEHSRELSQAMQSFLRCDERPEIDHALESPLGSTTRGARIARPATARPSPTSARSRALPICCASCSSPAIVAASDARN